LSQGAADKAEAERPLLPKGSEEFENKVASTEEIAEAAAAYA
jgi:hypothetical protein